MFAMLQFNSSSNPADPGAVTALMKLPDGTTVTPTVVRTATGTYQVQAYVWTLPGLHILRFTGTAPYPLTAEVTQAVAPLGF